MLRARLLKGTAVLTLLALTGCGGSATTGSWRLGSRLFHRDKVETCDMGMPMGMPGLADYGPYPMMSPSQNLGACPELTPQPSVPPLATPPSGRVEPRATSTAPPQPWTGGVREIR